MNKLLKKLFSIVIICILSFGLFACKVNINIPEVDDNDKDIVVLYTNDVHCGVEDGIGYAGLSYLKNELSTDNYVSLVDCGDAIQGDFIGSASEGENIIKIMNALDYDIAIPGNHEFDYTASTFISLTSKANFPYLSCNITNKTSGERIFDSYKIIEYGNIKVGFIGVTTPTTISSSSPDRFYDENNTIAYDFASGDNGKTLYNDVQTAVDDVKEAGADIVIALAHLGVGETYSPYTSEEVIANTSGIDVMLDGHSHTVIECERVKNKDGEYVLLSQTGTKLANVGMLVINKEGNISTGLISSVDGTDSEIEKVIEDIKVDYQEQLNVVVANAQYDLPIYENDVRISRNSETSIGDLIADAIRYYGDADIGIMNGGGLRTSIAKGDVTYGNLYAVMPFGNNICVIEATGQQIKDALECGVNTYPSENGGFLDVSGLTYEIDSTISSNVVLDDDGMFIKVDGAYRVNNIKVNGVDIDLNKTYTIAGSDYLLINKGNGLTMFEGCKVIKNEGYADVDVTISYITAILKGVIGDDYKNIHGSGRITIK